MKVTDSIINIGVNDKEIDLFEGQYPVKDGVSYNSYLIVDEKTALMDTVDKRGLDEWASNLKETLGNRTLDYIVVQHMEPDHSGALKYAIDNYPDAIVVGNAKTFQFLNQFFEVNITNRQLVVIEGDVLDLGSHKLTFVMAPMVHWPEVMVTYESTEGILFAADGFGKFGAVEGNDTLDNWSDEARRYFINIVGKYGAMVQTLLKKAAALDIKKILPLHGPVLEDNIGHYVNLYDLWSSYKPEEKGVLVAYASIHGNTREAANFIAGQLEEKGENVKVVDLARTSMCESVSLAFKYDRMVLCAATYDGGAFVPMEDFLHHLQIKGFQNRTVGLVENGTWGPMAAKAMRGYLETMKNITIVEPVVTIKSSFRKENEEAALELVNSLL